MSLIIDPYRFAGAGWALKAHTVAASSTGGSVTSSAIDTTGSDLVIIAHAFDVATSPGALSDNKSNTWTVLTTATVPGSMKVRLWYCQAPTVGTGHTFTIPFVGVSYPAIAVVAFSGSVASPFDAQNGSNAAASTVQPGTITPALNNELVIASLGLKNGAAPSIDGGFTITDSATTGANNWGVALAYLVQTTAAAANPTWTSTGSNGLATTIASFKGA